jgi:predicted FMN-binding regulatory protein PaiB
VLTWKTTMPGGTEQKSEAKLAEIVAFSIEIGRIVGKSKMSQNRDRIDHKSVREVMEESGQNRLASRMQAHVSPEPPLSGPADQDR